MTTRTLFASVVFAGLAAGIANPVASQSYPSRPIEIINSVNPGGGTDLNVRALQVAAERALGQPLVQVFKPGGAGTIAVSDVVNAPPDGYKLLVATPGELIVVPNVLKTPYSAASFSYIARISSKPYGIVVNSKSPWKTLEDMRRDSDREPNKYTIGTTQAGAVFVTVKDILRRGNIKLTTVPFSGAGPYLISLLGGHIDSALSPMAAAESYLKARTMRLLAVTGPSRMTNHKDVPTLNELGIDIPYVQWVGVVAPKGLPQDRLALLTQAFGQIVKDPVFLETAAKLGLEVAYASGEEFEKQVRQENELIRELVDDLKIKPQ